MLKNPLIDPDAVMAPFARQVLSRLAAARQPLLLVMAIALHFPVSTGQWDARTNPTQAEKDTEKSAQETRQIKSLVLH